jgi:hypothetical protein
MKLVYEYKSVFKWAIQHKLGRDDHVTYGGLGLQGEPPTLQFLTILTSCTDQRRMLKSGYNKTGDVRIKVTQRIVRLTTAIVVKQ